MSTIECCLLGLLGFLGTWKATALTHKYVLARSVLDVPNERSSHTVPTPRGGGVGFVLILLLVFAYTALRLPQMQPVMFSLWPALLVVGMLGFLDDKFKLAASLRLAVHFITAFWVLIMLNGLPDLGITGLPTGLHLAALILGSVLMVWILNLYNFMDGIDGIAAVQALLACVGVVIVASLGGHTIQTTPQIIALPLIVGMSMLGFLFWNFPPAKIFMGDVGSGFLGLLLISLAILSAKIDPKIFWAWMILLGIFIVDSSLTLFRRFLRRKKLSEAHRTHAYQYAARKYKSHKVVTVGALLVIIGWLLPLATLVGTNQLNPFTGVVIAYLPLVVVAYALGAGTDENKQ
jgi:Fuc2NAc and GlcNAc transferase